MKFLWVWSKQTKICHKDFVSLRTISTECPEVFMNRTQKHFPSWIESLCRTRLWRAFKSHFLLWKCTFSVFYLSSIILTQHQPPTQLHLAPPATYHPSETGTHPQPVLCKFCFSKHCFPSSGHAPDNWTRLGRRPSRSALELPAGCSSRPDSEVAAAPPRGLGTPADQTRLAGNLRRGNIFWTGCTEENEDEIAWGKRTSSPANLKTFRCPC